MMTDPDTGLHDTDPVGEDGKVPVELDLDDDLIDWIKAEAARLHLTIDETVEMILLRAIQKSETRQGGQETS